MRAFRFTVTQDLIDALVRRGYLQARDAHDQVLIEEAVLAMLNEWAERVRRKHTPSTAIH